MRTPRVERDGRSACEASETRAISPKTSSSSYCTKVSVERARPRRFQRAAMPHSAFRHRSDRRFRHWRGQPPSGTLNAGCRFRVSRTRQLSRSWRSPSRTAHLRKARVRRVPGQTSRPRQGLWRNRASSRLPGRQEPNGPTGRRSRIGRVRNARRKPAPPPRITSSRPPVPQPGMKADNALQAQRSTKTRDQRKGGDAPRRQGAQAGSGGRTRPWATALSATCAQMGQRPGLHIQRLATSAFPATRRATQRETSGSAL
jgi:hypothetical protein